MPKVYHMIIERIGDFEGITRKEYQSKKQGSAPDGWKCVGVCGYYEVKKEVKKEDE